VDASVERDRLPDGAASRLNDASIGLITEGMCSYFRRWEPNDRDWVHGFFYLQQMSFGTRLEGSREAFLSSGNSHIGIPAQTQLIPQVASSNNHNELRIRFEEREPIPDFRRRYLDIISTFQVCHVERDLAQ
jgi:hypothetical protein